jgi:hypothetical protein
MPGEKYSAGRKCSGVGQKLFPRDVEIYSWSGSLSFVAQDNKKILLKGRSGQHQ